MTLDVDRLLRSAARVRDDDVASFALAAAEAELAEEIMTTDIIELDVERERRNPRNRLRTKILASTAGLAAISLVVAGVLVTGGTKQAQEFAPAAVAVAQANSRLLVRAPSWKVTRADEFMTDYGEVTFSDGTSTLEVSWQPKRDYDPLIYKADETLADHGPITIAGMNGNVYAFGETSNMFAVLEPRAETFTTVRGDLGSLERFKEVASTIETVSVEEWLDAMPESVIKPSQRAATVNEMLQGVPLPPGFDAGELRSGKAIKDRYQLGAAVSGAVACGWLDAYTDAKASGDDAATQRAIDAMATSREWKVLTDMIAEGDYPKAVWEWADWMAGKAVPGHGWKSRAEQFGRTEYEAALGCDS